MAEEITAVEKLKAWVAENLEALKATNITTITGEYSGSGDEGQWEGVIFEPAERKLDAALLARVDELMEAATDELSESGYENGDGGGGEIKLIVATGKLLRSEYFYDTTRSYTAEDAEV